LKKRYIYSILFGIPGFFISLLFSLFIFGAAAGFLWIFVYGDNPWPATSGRQLPLLFILTLLVSWGIIITSGFITGKKLESAQGLNTKHIMLSVAATIIPVVLITLQQLHVGNLGHKTDTVLCSEYCSKKGYTASGMPPENSGIRECSCYDNDGKEVLKSPINSILQNQQLDI
jgi:hypothetical protein